MKQHRGMGYANKKTQACQMAQAKMKIISLPIVFTKIRLMSCRSI